MLEALSSVTTLVVGIVLYESSRERVPQGVMLQSSAFAAVALNTLVASISAMFASQPIDATERGLEAAQRGRTNLGCFSEDRLSEAYYHCFATSGFMLYLARLVTASLASWSDAAAPLEATGLQHCLQQDKHLLQMALQVQTAGIRCVLSIRL